MYTVYLLRDNKVTTPGYTVFLASQNDTVHEKTVNSFVLYDQAIIEAFIVYRAARKAFQKVDIACYIENNYESSFGVQYTKNQFVRSDYGLDWFRPVYDMYQGFLATDSPHAALLRVISSFTLNNVQVTMLKQAVGHTRPTLVAKSD